MRLQYQLEAAWPVQSWLAECHPDRVVVRHGAQITGSDDPNITTAGTPNAAAIWAGPESFPTKSIARERSDFTSDSGDPATVR